MIYSVKLHTGVEDQITEAMNFIARSSPLNAERWLRGMFAAISSLREMPQRCPPAGSGTIGRIAICGN